MKPSLLPCGCEDGTCEQCVTMTILELDEMIEKTSVTYYNSDGSIKFILPTRTVMELKRLTKK